MLRQIFFYVDDGMVASANLGCLQTVFYMLTGLFDHLGLNKNVRKTVGMVLCPCQAAEVRADKAYTWRMKGLGRSYKERQWERVICPECGKDLERGQLDAHFQTQNGMVNWGLGQEEDREGRGDKPRTYRMEFLAKSGLRPCPVEG